MDKKIIEEYIDITNSLFLVLNLDGTIEYANKKLCDLFGITQEEMVNKNWFENFHQDEDKEKIDKIHTDIKNNNVENHRIKDSIIKIDEDNFRNIVWYNSFIKDEDGNIVKIVSSGEDVTEYKELLDEKNKIIDDLKKSESKLQISMQVSNIIYWEWDLSKNNISYTDNFKKLGVSLIENGLKTWRDHLVLEDKEKALNKMKAFLESNSDYYENEYRIKCDDGKIKWISARGKKIFNKNSSERLLIGTFQDITEKKKLEENLKNKQKILKMIKDFDAYILQETDEENLFNKTTQMIVNTGIFSHSVIAYINKDKEKTFEIKNTTGIDERIINDYVFSYDPNSDFFCSSGVCINSGKTEVFKRGTFLKLWNKESKQLGYNASISIPIKVFGEIIGTYSIFSKQENIFDESMIRTLEQLVINLDLAIERLRKDKKLKEFNEQNESILNSMTDFVKLLDKDLTVKWANNSSLNTFPNIIGNKCHKIIINSDEPCYDCACIKAIKSSKTEKSIQMKTVIKEGKEKEIYFDNTAIPQKNEMGEVTRIVEISRDITESIESNIRERHLLKVLKAIQEVQKIIIKEKNNKNLIKEICKCLIATREYHDCWAILYDKEMNPIFCYQANEEKKFKNLCEKALEGNYTDCVDKALEERKSIKTKYPEEECTSCFASNLYEDKSAITIPIKYESRIYGVLYLSVEKYFADDERENKLLMDISDEIGYALNSIEEQKKLIKTEEQRILAFEKIKSNQEIFIQSLGKVVEMRDPYTSGHQRRVAELAIEIAKNMYLSKQRIDAVRIASLLHDIGKIYIPTEILNKAGKLSDLEFKMIQEHSQYGFELLKGLEFDFPVPEFVLQHHERINGAGYPNGLNDEEIHLESKIIAVADVVEAISSHRPYRAALGLDVALEEIKNNSGILYDEEIVEACLKAFKNGFEFGEQNK